MTIETLRERLEGFRFDTATTEIRMRADGIQFNVTTARTSYSIAAFPQTDGRFKSYLGCIASDRATGKGRDMADGPFTSETWSKILEDMFAFEARR